MSNASAAQDARVKLSSGAALTLALLTLSYMLAYFDRMLIVVVGEMIKHEFSLSDKQLSLLTGASFLLLYGAAAIVSGWLLDRYNRKAILVAALVVWSVMTSMCGFARNFMQLAIARAGVGLGEAPSLPAAFSILGDTYPLSKLPMANAVVFTGSVVGIMGSFLLGSWLATTYGWRTAFLVAGPPGILLAFAMMIFVKEPPRIGKPEISGQSDRSTLSTILKNRPLVIILSAGSLSIYANIGMMLWLPMFFIRTHGLTTGEVGAFFGPTICSGLIVGMLLGGYVGNLAAARSTQRLLQICVVLMIVVVPLYLLVLWVPSLKAALGLTFLTAIVSAMYNPNYNVAWQAVAHPSVRATTAGVSGFGSNIIGGALCPFFVGMLSDILAPSMHDQSLRCALSFSLVFCLVGAALFVMAIRTLGTTGQTPTRR